MKRLKCFLFSFVFAFSLAPVIVNAQSDQSAEFISIDCGLPLGSDYTDNTTGLNYVSDADLITSGQSNTTLSNSLQRAYSTVRSFPQGIRNCYTLQPSRGTGSKYLIRASFVYGNYDSKNALPSFDIYVGADKWDTVVFNNMSTPYTTEIIHSLSSDSLHICLIKTGVTTPFISTLELRPMNSTNVAYKTDHGSLLLYSRVYFGAATTTQRIRYGDDQYDRIWEPFSLGNTTTISASSDFPQNDFKLPNAVLRTANTPDNVNGSIAFYWDANVMDQWYFAMHSAEVQVLKSTEYRAFDIYINGDNILKESVVPVYLQPVTYYLTKPRDGSSRYYCTLNKTSNSTLPPLINAVEIYKVRLLSSLSTDETDVEAITRIRSTYAITRDWQGDPCLPRAYVWGGLKCSYQDSETTRIISLDLSGSGLMGVIASSISNLTHLKSLDLSNNKLTGQVPDFLSQLTSLSTLNLKGNNFTGPIPAQLVEKSNNGLLTLSFDDSDNTTKTNPCTNCSKKKSKSSIVPIVVGVVAVVVVIFAAVSTAIWMSKRKKQQVNVTSGGQIDPTATNKGGEIEEKGRKFAYSEVLNITNNFQRILGKGGFGTVYHGYVGNTQVAVKMLSSSSTQGYKEFQAEAQILTTVHHKNLCSLVGYCNEGTNMGIIYEYLANGNLQDHLSGRISNSLSWEKRLGIAIDAAQGLEYLHHGCKPQIIHRDVKTNNILLTETFQAKLADFGLSRAYPVEGGTHVSTVVAGTPGYLDPDYYTSNRLTEKSDVYSFGVVLLEMITGKPAISRGQENTHIVQWVDSIVRNGDVKQAVDPRFRGDYDVNSVWKAVELAMVCASENSARRPTMNVVVTELKECLKTELAGRDQDSNNSYGDVVASMSMEGDMAPMAR